MAHHLVLAGVPVVQEAGGDEEGVVLMAILAVVPAAVVAHFGFAPGRAHWTLAACTQWGEVRMPGCSVYTC